MVHVIPSAGNAITLGCSSVAAPRRNLLTSANSTPVAASVGQGLVQRTLKDDICAAVKHRAARREMRQQQQGETGPEGDIAHLRLQQWSQAYRLEQVRKKEALAVAVDAARENGMCITSDMLRHAHICCSEYMAQKASWMYEPDAYSSETVAYEALLNQATLAIRSAASVYIVTLTSYTRVGQDIALECQTLASEFTLKVPTGTSVAELAALIHKERKLRTPEGSIKILSPKGFKMAPSRIVLMVLDLAIDGSDHDDDLGEFYALSILTSATWKELGLNGPSRWKHLRGDHFKHVFGMDKADFERLLDWKQVQLKRKHNLF